MAKELDQLNLRLRELLQLLAKDELDAEGRRELNTLKEKIGRKEQEQRDRNEWLRLSEREGLALADRRRLEELNKKYGNHQKLPPRGPVPQFATDTYGVGEMSIRDGLL